MYNNIGLRTARGSGTNGYIQRNLAYLPQERQEFIVGLKVRQQKKKNINKKLKKLKFDNNILQHNKRKKIEIMICNKRIQLESKGMNEDEINKILDDYRDDLMRNGIDNSIQSNNDTNTDNNTHIRSKKMIEKNKRFLNALNLHENDDGTIVDLKKQKRQQEMLEYESKLNDIERMKHEIDKKTKHFLDHSWNPYKSKSKTKHKRHSISPSNSPSKSKNNNNNKSSNHSSKSRSRSRSRNKSKSRSNSRGRFRPKTPDIKDFRDF